MTQIDQDRLDAVRRLRGTAKKDQRQVNRGTDLPLRGLALIYPRLSTHELVKRALASVERQRSLENLAIQDGYSATMTADEAMALKTGEGYPGCHQNGRIIYDERDLGISGTRGRDDRHTLDRYIELIKAGRVESIYTVEISRLWRDKRLTGDGDDEGGSTEYNDALRFGHLLKRHGVILVLPHMRLNLNDAMHWRIYMLEIQRAAEELQIMQYRLGGARALRARQGRYYGGARVPAGFRLDWDSKSSTYLKYLEYGPHAEIVRLIYEKFRDTQGAWFAVVHACQNEGIVLPAFEPQVAAYMDRRSSLAYSYRTELGWPITETLLRSIIGNPAHIGTWQYLDTEIRENHPAIVDENLFWRCVELATTNRKPQRRGRAAHIGPMLLAGLLYCGNHEGEPRRMSSSRNRFPAYVCDYGYRSRNEDHCLAVRDYILDKPITEAVLTNASHAEHADAVLRALGEEPAEKSRERVELERQVRGLRKDINQAEQNIKKFRKSEHFDPSEYMEMVRDKQATEERLRDIEERALSLGEPSGLTDEQVARIKAFLADLRTGWDNLSLELRREYLQLVLEKIIIRHTPERILCRIVYQSGRVQEIMIHRPFVDERVPWSDEEKALVREHFESATIERLMELLPGRTWVGVYKFGRALGLKRPHIPNGGGAKRSWEPWENDLIRRYYAAEITKDELQAKLPDRGWCGIKMQANRGLHLKWVKRKQWEPDLRWEEVPAGTYALVRNVATVTAHRR